MAWYLDGKNLSTLAWNVKNRSAGWSVPGKVGANISVPGKHGTFWNPNKPYGEGFLTLSMWAQGCYEDGSLPNDEDGKKKVRDNLDGLTSLFANSSRLLTLRQKTGTDMALVNELTNPTLTTRATSGQTLAVNGVKDPDNTSTRSTEVSRNISTNPYLVGRNWTWNEITEDLFPDPTFQQYARNPAQQMFRSYYYPILQDVSTYNQFFTPYNGFSYTTGVNRHGVINLSHSPDWTTNAFVGLINRHVNARRQDGTILYLSLRLSSNQSYSSIPVRITPMISYDGDNWTEGTPSTHTVEKNYKWIVIRPTDLPEMTEGTGFYVGYRIQIYQTPTSWNRGAVFEVSRLAIQEGPRSDNPWRNAVNVSHMIVGAQTPYIWYSGNHGNSWSVLNRTPVPDWQMVNTGSQSTTSPYGFAWAHNDTANNDTWETLTAFGGTRSTFRRELPVPRNNQTNVRIWGRCYQMHGTSTLRVSRRSGSAGSYTYTQVGSVTVNGGNFISNTFDIVAGENYVIEADIPASTNSLEPALILRELHISNGYVNTSLARGRNGQQWGAGATSANYTGPMYRSTIAGVAAKIPGVFQGIPHNDAKANSSSNVAWNNESRGVYSEHGAFSLDTRPLPSGTTSVSVRTSLSLGAPEHLVNYLSNVPGTAVGLHLEFRDQEGEITRTATTNFSGNTMNNFRTFSYTADVQAGEVMVTPRLTLPVNYSYFMGFIVRDFHLMTNKPDDVHFFTGRDSSAIGNWTKTVSWRNAGYFSESSLSAPIPSNWTVSGFNGFDADNSVRFKGGTVRIQTDLPAGQAYVGYRRGTHTGNLTITAQPQGASSATALGSTSSSKNFAQAMVTIPSGGATYIDFHVTGGSPHKTIKEVFAIHSWSNIFPIPSSSWAGFRMGDVPQLSLVEHPSSQHSTTRAIRNSNGTVSYVTGSVAGWTGTVLSGGYVPLPKSGDNDVVASAATPVSGGYVSAAVRILPANDVSGKLSVEVQGATAAQMRNGTWDVLRSEAITSSEYRQVRIVDIPVEGKQHIRLAVRVDNSGSTPLTRNGIAGIIDGATLTPTPLPIGGNFPGYFVGVRASDGTSSYRGDIRQAKVEVVESFDMTSMAYGQIAEFVVNMTVPGSFWEDVYDTTTTASSPASVRNGHLYIADFNGATAPMDDLMFEIEPLTGSLSRLTITDKASGNTFKYSGAGQSRIVINSEDATVQDINGNSIIQHVTQIGTSGILTLAPYWREAEESMGTHVDGTPVLEWDANVGIRVTITGRRKYLIG